MDAPIRIAQLSDTHFLERDADAEGLHAYDTKEAFDAVFEHLGDHDHLDLVAVTGDVADHGRPPQYDLAADAFSRFRVPVNVCAGNHDHDATFEASIARPGVSTSSMISIGNWAFLFADSSAGTKSAGPSGLEVDHDRDDRLHNNGALGPREAERIRRLCAATTADHVFVWLHHPPAPTVPLCHDDRYADEWRALLAELPRVRGLAGGHTHVPTEHEVEGRPVFVAPSLKNNFCLEDRTFLPPGYRTFEFFSDGTIASDLHLVDDERWPRRRFGRAVHSLFMGELTYEELAEIGARRPTTG